MKNLAIKTLTVKGMEIDNPTTTDLVKACLNTRPEGGYSYEDLKNRQRIEKACKKAEDEKAEEIVFEDNDATNLKQMVKTMKWALRHQEILDFHEQVDKL